MSEDLAVPPFKDRSAGLIVFGSVELLMGGCCALMMPLTFLNVFLMRSMPAAQVPTTHVGTMAYSALFYASMAAFYITMGVGSIRARRWARTLLLVTSWIWLVSGVLAFIMMLLMFPILNKGMVEAAGGGSSLPAVFFWVMGAVMLFIYVLLPAVFVIFYRSPHVRATCEDRDPKVPWTDRCPAPLLAASLLSGAGAVTLLGLALLYRVLPFFGLLQGLPAAAVGLALAAFQGFTSVELYRQRWRGWWTGIATASLGMVANAVAFWNLDAVAFYEAMGYTRDWAERMAPALVSMRWLMVTWAPIWLAFLVWVRRYLPPASTRA